MNMGMNWVLSLAQAILVVERSSAGGFKDGVAVDRKDLGGAAAFRMPLHYPRYVKSDYETMEEWKVDLLLQEYGLDFRGSLDEKRRFAMGAFLWPEQF